MALRIALDTNRFSDLGRGDAELLLLVEQAEAVFLPFVVVAELRAGFSLSQRFVDPWPTPPGKPDLSLLAPFDPRSDRLLVCAPYAQCRVWIR